MCKVYLMVMNPQIIITKSAVSPQLHGEFGVFQLIVLVFCSAALLFGSLSPLSQHRSRLETLYLPSNKQNPSKVSN